MAAKGLTYAEESLGVHAVYEAAKEARKELGSQYGIQTGLRFVKRELENKLRDREMELTIDERSKHADQSQAAFDRHIKIVFAKDSSLQKIREEIRATEWELDKVEAQIELLKNDVRIFTGRMEELGGYLSYLAAIKLAGSQPAISS